MKSYINILFSILFLSLFSLNLNAQEEQKYKSSTSHVDIFSAGRYHIAFEAEGNINPSKSGIEGSPYVNNMWQKGKLILKNGKTVSNLGFRFNALYEKMEVFYEKKSHQITKPEKIDRIVLFDAKKNVKKIYDNVEYINHQNKKETGFLELLADGKYKIYKKYKGKMLKPNYNMSMSSGNKNSRIVKKHFYLIKTPNSLPQPINKKWKNFISYFGNKKKQVEEYMEYVGLYPTEQKDLITIVRYANSLN
jgi:hypothetical protein